MIGFLIKKSFFDSWDNLVFLVILNLGSIVVIAVLVGLPLVGAGDSLPGFLLLGIPGFLLLGLYNGLIFPSLQEISNYRTPSLKDAIRTFRKVFRQILVVTLLNLVVSICVVTGLLFYQGLGGIMGAFGGGLVFWAAIFWYGSIQYYLPLLCRFHGGATKNLKKSFLIFAGNPGFSVFVMFWSFLIWLLSIPTALLIPGTSSILLFRQVAFKLRFYKYDYIEEHGGDLSAKIKIPWDEMLEEDRECVGPRSLKGMIFPWKD